MIVRELSQLLAREREAALAADMDTLEALQEQKRALLAQAADEGGVASPAFERLAEIARANVALIRQLVVVHRALAGLPPAGYGADGRHGPAVGPRLTRGVG